MNLCRCILAIACLSVASLAMAENPVRSVKPEDLEKFWVMMKDSVQGDAPHACPEAT